MSHTGENGQPKARVPSYTPSFHGEHSTSQSASGDLNVQTENPPPYSIDDPNNAPQPQQERRVNQTGNLDSSERTAGEPIRPTAIHPRRPDPDRNGNPNPNQHLAQRADQAGVNPASRSNYQSLLIMVCSQLQIDVAH